LIQDILMSITIEKTIQAIQDSEQNGLLCDRAKAIITGYSGDKIVGLLQRFTSFFSQNYGNSEVCYLEVGVFKGMTLLSTAVSCPNFPCYGIDNFAYFDKEGKNLSIVIERQNRLGVCNAHLIQEDYEDALLNLPARIDSKKVGVYFIDGPHDYRSELMCLEMGLPYLHENALIVVDDCNYRHIRQAVNDFLITHPEYKLIFEAYTKCHPNHMNSEEYKEAVEGWWNGVNVLVKDIHNEITPIFPPTERSRLLYENEHQIHPFCIADIAPEGLKLLYSLYQEDRNNQSLDRAKLNSFFKKIDELHAKYQEQGYLLKKQMNTFSKYLPKLTVNLPGDDKIQILPQKNRLQMAVDYFQTAKKLQRKKRFPESIFFYRKAIELHSQLSWFHNCLGETLAEIGDWQEAISSYYQAISLNPRNAYFYYNLAKALLHENQTQKAIDFYQKAIEIQPNLPKLWAELGNAWKTQQEIDKAISCWQKTIELKPDFLSAYVSLIEILIQQQKRQRAEYYLQQAFQLLPTSEPLQVLKSQLYG